MLRGIKKSADLFLFSHIFLSLAALSQVLLTANSFKIQCPLSIDLIIFLSTYMIYGYSMVNFRWKGIRSDGSSRQNFIAENYAYLKITILLSSGLLFILSFFISRDLFLVFLLESILCLFYSIPFFKNKEKSLSFRGIPGIKNIVISLLWAISVVLIPVYAVKGLEIFSSPKIYYFFTRAFLLLMIITLLFDYRDIEIDFKKNTKTLSSLIGPFGTKALCFFLILILIILNEFYKSDLSNREYWTFHISSLMLCILLGFTRRGRTDYFYMLFLDGLIFIQFPLLILLALFIKN